ncbi:Wadjet anti-phage system protein JetD domain-containing protein [Acidithiobacillus ferrooxidans]|uniref:Wadjet anti-phage system protein JetD domain-containing protein n=1 Tax=Acidithiobacillus ferrooxidans TaxID=920 RepID=UPI001C07C9A8|nr:Wadjet anti-phage system protein JetD domain-containing protein [Acidithiobacillus ferrooxidans]
MPANLARGGKPAAAPGPATELTLLTKQEQQLYRDLKQQRWGQNVRLEQERIDWAAAWSVLQRTPA